MGEMNMRRRSLIMNILCLATVCTLVAGSMTIDVYAVTRSQSEGSSSETDETDSKTKTRTTTKTEETTDGASDAAATDTAAEDTTSKSSKSKSSKSTVTGSSSGSSKKTDEKGNTILMTQKQREKRFKSKTNPKRGEKIPNVIYKPNYLGFTYADFSTCNSYNSENGLGGRPIYLLGTIMDIEKVYENNIYYGVAIMVNDCDGYQWYMRADIAKNKYEIFKNAFLGKAGYIYGFYSGYSGVTNRPMMDVTVIHLNGLTPINVAYYQM